MGGGGRRRRGEEYSVRIVHEVARSVVAVAVNRSSELDSASDHLYRSKRNLKEERVSKLRWRCQVSRGEQISKEKLCKEIQRRRKGIRFCQLSLYEE